MAVADFSGVIDSGIDYPNVPSRAHPEGRTYRVESPNAKDGLLFAGMTHLGAMAAYGGQLDKQSVSRLQLDDDDERDFYARVLGCTEECRRPNKSGKARKPCGSTHDQMVADGVGWDWFETISQHAYLHFFVGPESAAKYLADRGKAPAPEKAVPVPNRADKRTAAKAGRKSAPASGGSASRTRRAATGSSNRTGTAAAKAQKTA